jgi:hypothetical protein
MSRQQSERDLKRLGRVLAGHTRDKDRQRWKRKVTGQAKPPEPGKGIRAIRDELVDETALAEIDGEAPEE